MADPAPRKRPRLALLAQTEPPPDWHRRTGLYGIAAQRHWAAVVRRQAIAAQLAALAPKPRDDTWMILWLAEQRLELVQARTIGPHARRHEVFQVRRRPRSRS